VLATALLCAACGAEPAAEPSAALLRPSTRDHLAGVIVTLDVQPAEVEAGDTLRFIIRAHNPTSAEVQLGIPCGPPADVRIEREGDPPFSLLDSLYPGNGFTCALTGRHTAGPGETEVLPYPWPAPRRPGRYLAVAGLRRADGLGNLSAPVRFRIR
jgi:hypothetical protein